MKAHPEYEISALVRNSDKGVKIASQYSKVKLVYGTLDDAEVLEDEAKKADLVLRMFFWFYAIPLLTMPL